MDFYIKKGLTLIGVLLLGYILFLAFGSKWYQILIGIYVIVFIYVVLKNWKKWKALGIMINELIKTKMGVTEVDESNKKD